MQDHLLLISEDEGNVRALELAVSKLQAGDQVSWICSTPSTTALEQVEQIAALKNLHMATLNLLVITREEKQPFTVLTGPLNVARLEDCAELLFDPTTVSDCSIAVPPALAEQLGAWAITHLGEARITTHSIAANVKNILNPDSSPSNDMVAVTIIKQGRETRFRMQRQAGTLLDGAEDADIDLPFSCRGGVCSTCRARLRTGEVALMENYALEDWELEAGFTLPCQAEPISSEITLDYDEV